MKRIVVVLGAAVAMAVVAVLVAPHALAISGCEGEGGSCVGIADVSPDGGTTNVSRSTNVTSNTGLSRTCTLDNRIFYLKKQGAKRRVQATVAADPSNEATTILNPLNDLRAGATYKATIALTYLDSQDVSVPGSEGWYFKSSTCLARFGGISDPSATFNDEKGKITWTFRTASN